MLKRRLAYLLLISIIFTAGCNNQDKNEPVNSVTENTINDNNLDDEVIDKQNLELAEENANSSVVIIENTNEELLDTISDNSVTYTNELETQEDTNETETQENINETEDTNAEFSANTSEVMIIDSVSDNSITLEDLSETPDNNTDGTTKTASAPYTFPFDSARDLSKPFLNNEPGKLFILDVDMNTDVDDVCAVRMATALDDLGVIDLKAVCYCTDYSSYGALRGILHHDMKDDVLMGQGTEDRHEGSPYWNELGKHNDFGGNWEGSVRQYRKVLANATSPVDIVTTGQVTNLEALLESGPDDISPLTGKELVMTKVGQLYITGGDYPDGWSNNLALTNAATIATKYVVQNWGLPIIWSPGNHSGKLTCGKYLQDLDVYRKDPVTRALDAWGVSAGRAAWDPFAVWVGGYACAETNQVSLTQCSFGIQDGGANWFKEDPNGDDWVLNLTNTDLNYYNQTLDNHLIHIFSKVYGVENPNKEPIGLEVIR